MNQVTTDEVFEPWLLPIKADYARDLILLSLSDGEEGLNIVVVEEDDVTKWIIKFNRVQGYRVTPHELTNFICPPMTGGLFEIKNSKWIRAYKDAGNELVDNSRHFLVLTYDDYIEVLCYDYDVIKVE